MRDPDNCNDVSPAPGIQGECHPFEEVRDAALSLVDRMYFPYDRMAVISFDRNAVAQLNMSNDPSAIKSAIGNLTVFKLYGCPTWPPNPSGCTSTNIADGLKVGGTQYGSFFREEAVPILILLSDGSANAATDNSTPPPRMRPSIRVTLSVARRPTHLTPRPPPAPIPGRARWSSPSAWAMK